MEGRIHYVIEAALGIAVIVLFALFFSGSKGTKISGIASLDSSSVAGGSMPMAYITVDSLMQKYQYSIDLIEQLTRKYENSRVNLAEKYRKFQADVDDFQRKVETGAFASQERAESEQQRLLKKREEMQHLEAQLSEEFAGEQMRLNEDLRQKIILQVKEFNKSKGYHIILGKRSDNMFFADEAYDITNEVIAFLNKNYTAIESEETSTTTPATTTPKKTTK